MSVETQSLAGKVCVVTGGTAGIGWATAQGLACRGAQVVVVARDAERAAAAVDRICEESGNPAVDSLQADLSDQAQVRGLAADLLDRYPALHVLVNNAGGFYMRRRVSADGIELTWALNLLAPFQLIHLLLDRLKASGSARVVNVSSDMQRAARIEFDDLQGERRYSGMRAYGQSKLALLLFTYELARRLEGTSVTANALHPGFVSTEIYRSVGRLGVLVRPLMNLMAVSPEEGARSSVYLASSPEVEGVSGNYFKEMRPAESSPLSYDEAAARRL